MYFTFADLPPHMITQSSFWFMLTICRSSLVAQFPGEVSGLMKRIVLRLFTDSNANFDRGIVLTHADHSSVFRAHFGGFLSDEKALKEIFGLKGASGSKPCPTCSNVAQFMDADAMRGTSLVGLSCIDMSALQYHTNASFYSMVDCLSQAKASRAHVFFCGYCC